MPPMVTVTDSAKEEFVRILSTKELDSGKYFRLAIPPVWTGAGDFGIVIDSEQEDDLTIEHAGQKILLLDHDLAHRLENSVLDFKESPEGPRFTLDVF